MLNFISDNDNKGTFIYNNSPDMDKALQDLAEWILNVVRTIKKPATQYVLLNETVNYTLFYNDYEDDPQMDAGRWMYSHDHEYFENSLGQASYHEQWLTEPKTSFDKVGKFTTIYETRDNPVGSDDRFDNYRKTSEMLNGPLNIFVHRKPIAQLTATVTKVGSTELHATFNTDSSYDIDHQSLPAGYYRLDDDDNLVPADSSTGTWVYDKGIVDKQMEWKEVGDDTWHSIGEGETLIGTVDKDYLVRLRVRDIDGHNLLGAWSDEVVILVTLEPQPPVAQFTVTPSSIIVGETLEVTDQSYDPNGDPITNWEWKLNKVSGASQGQKANPTYTSSNYSDAAISNVVNNAIQALAAADAIGDYELTLRVRDDTGLWSEEVKRTIRVNPPVLQVVGSYEGDPIVGETIKLKAETTQYANNVKVDFLGDLITLTHVSTVGNTKYWEVEYTIPDTVTESGIYEAVFTATDIFGQVATHTIQIEVIVLRLTNFRITNIVNHNAPPYAYSYPLTRVSLPVNYKAGYYVTFCINGVGNPDNVTARIYQDTAQLQTINLINAGVDGNETIYQGRFYTEALLPQGTVIKINLKANKSTTEYDYNEREGWADGGTIAGYDTGRILIVNGSALQDGRINRTN